MCRASNYHIWALCHIRRLMRDDLARTLACSIVATRLYYCKSILYNASYRHTVKFHKVSGMRCIKCSKACSCHSSAAVSALAACCTANSFRNERRHIQCKENIIASISLTCLTIAICHRQCRCVHHVCCWQFVDAELNTGTTLQFHCLGKLEQTPD